MVSIMFYRDWPTQGRDSAQAMSASPIPWRRIPVDLRQLQYLVSSSAAPQLRPKQHIVAWCRLGIVTVGGAALSITGRSLLRLIAPRLYSSVRR